MKTISLCSGYLGLDLAVEAVTDAHLIGWSEIDPHACEVARHHYPHADELGDLTTRTDWPTADVLTAGFPCQPVSHAGQRRGHDDDRWLWDDVLRTIRLVGPRLVVLENVAGLLTLGGPRVVGDLAALGMRVRWSTLRASDIGAPHQRRRVFIVATHPDDDRREGWSQLDGGTAAGLDRASGRHVARRSVEGDRPGGDGPALGEPADLTLLPTPNASLQNYDEDPETFLARREEVRQKGINGNGVGLPLGVAVKTDWGRYAGAVAQWERILGRPAPQPLDGRHLNARFVEWMMGLPDGWVTDIIPNRRAALRMLGNGVVPQQAAAAINALLTPAWSATA